MEPEASDPTDLTDLAFVEVYRPENPSEIPVIEALLAARGIPYRFDSRHLDALLPLSSVGVFSTRLLVEAGRAEECRTLLREALPARGERAVIEALVDEGDARHDHATSRAGEQDGTDVRPQVEVPARRLLWEVILVSVVGVLPAYLTLAMNAIWPLPPASPAIWSPYYFMFSQLGYALPPIAVVLYLVWRDRQWKLTGLTRSWYVKDLAIAALILAVDFHCVLPLASFLEEVFQLPFVEPSTPRVENGIEFVVVVAGIALGAFGEELIFRGYLLPRLERLLRSTVLSVLATSLLFAGYHAYQGPGGVLGVFLGGLLYGIAFVLSRRVWPVAAAHAAYNFLWMLV